MLDKLSSALKKTTDRIANAIFLDKDLVESVIKDLQRALIEADVNVQLVKEISQKLKKVALEERVKGIEKKEHLIKILHEELIKILGEKREIILKKSNRIMLVGLYGSGKTTTISKLALYYSKRGKKVCAIGLDVHRPAAAEQLKQSCTKLNIPVFISPEEKNPSKIWKKYEKELDKYELILIDTAGRDSLEEDLIKEIKSINKLVKPTETILCITADIGQTAKKQAQAFKEALDITGVIITRMDSTAKGGGALTACAETKAPVYFIATGEKINDLEEFNPKSFLSRLLGMGDLEALLEKAKEVIKVEDAEDLGKRFLKGEFNLIDLYEQMEAMSKMGPLSQIVEMIPGFSSLKLPKEMLQVQEGKLKKWKVWTRAGLSESQEAREFQRAKSGNC